MFHTIQEKLREAADLLRGTSDAPEIDAERLLLFVLAREDATWLVARGDEELSLAQMRRFDELVAERATGKPLAYILGSWEFYGREFVVTEDVLVPRPETENLVDEALKKIDVLYEELGRKLTIADIGTGSGIIAVTLLLESDKVEKVFATDVSPAVLRIAKENAKKHEVIENIEFLEGSMFEPLRDKGVDLIVSNPPYVPSAEVARAGDAQETTGLKFEPVIALDGGVDGQDFVKLIKTTGVPAVVETLNGEIDVM